MNEELNLVEILKNVPAGTEFYCSVVGECKLFSINTGDYPIGLECIDNKNLPFVYLDEYGRMYKEEGECVLFPSKDQRDWRKFKLDLPIDTPVMACSIDCKDWALRFYSGNNECFIQGYKSVDKEISMFWKYIVPVSDFDFTNPESNINKSI